MKKPKILVAFLLDETGSMMEGKAQTISAFNEYVASLKGLGARFSLTRFNSESIQQELEAVTIDQVPFLTDSSYRPTACTPLCDAMGKTLDAVEGWLERQGWKRPPKVLFVVLTDGMENASKEYGRHAIKQKVEEKQGQGWEFVFLGADMDAWNEAMLFGFRRGSVASIGRGEVQDAMRATRDSTVRYATTGVAGDFFAGTDYEGR